VPQKVFSHVSHTECRDALDYTISNQAKFIINKYKAIPEFLMTFHSSFRGIINAYLY